MEAFRLGRAGADAIDSTSNHPDRQLAVIHDETLDRTTDRTGSVASLSMDAIREADAGANFSRPDDAGLPFAGQGHRVPTLPEVLAWLPDGIGLVIEIKPRAAADAVVEAVRGHAVRDDGRLAVISFDEVPSPRARAHPESRTATAGADPGHRPALVGPRERPCSRTAWAGTSAPIRSTWRGEGLARDRLAKWSMIRSDAAAGGLRPVGLRHQHSDVAREALPFGRPRRDSTSTTPARGRRVPRARLRVVDGEGTVTSCLHNGRHDARVTTRRRACGGGADVPGLSSITRRDELQLAYSALRTVKDRPRPASCSCEPDGTRSSPRQPRSR